MHKPFVIKSKPFEFGGMGFLNKKPGRFLPLMSPNWSFKNYIDTIYSKIRNCFGSSVSNK